MWKRSLLLQSTNILSNFFSSQYSTGTFHFLFVVRYSSSEEGGAIDIRSGSTSTISTGRRTDKLTDNRYRAAVLLTQDFFSMRNHDLGSRISISDPGSRSRIPDPKTTKTTTKGGGRISCYPFMVAKFHKIMQIIFFEQVQEII
jgi:hypothetical protein